LPTFGSIFGKPDLKPPVWYGISARSFFPALRPAGYLKALFATSAEILQWREKDLGQEELAPLIVLGSELARATGKIFLVNTALDAALAGGADGVHLTSSQEVGPSVSRRREAGRAGFIIGKSVHSGAEAVEAERQGADYVLLGPVFDPLSKPAARSSLGLDGLREAVSLVRIPVFALGGIDRSNCGVVLATGVAGVAGITWLREEVRP
jgi:thiamine-phosphate pyrophosphorylase